jgi:hypothetical protein
MKRLLTILFLFIGVTVITPSYIVFAQDKDSTVTALTDQAIALCRDKQYAASEKTFKQLFGVKGVVLPDEVAYFYGVSSFYLKKYTQARTAFDRFETLSQASDSLKEESVEFRYDMDCYEKGYFEYLDVCMHCDGEGHLDEPCVTCKGNGRQYCPVCSGTGVAVSRGSLGGDNYSTCNRCAGKGVIDCLTCKGKGHLNQPCSVCKGKGTVTMRGVCKDE